MEPRLVLPGEGSVAHAVPLLGLAAQRHAEEPAVALRGGHAHEGVSGAPPRLCRRRNAHPLPQDARSQLAGRFHLLFGLGLFTGPFPRFRFMARFPPKNHIFLKITHSCLYVI